MRETEVVSLKDGRRATPSLIICGDGRSQGSVVREHQSLFGTFLGSEGPREASHASIGRHFWGQIDWHLHNSLLVVGAMQQMPQRPEQQREASKPC